MALRTLSVANLRNVESVSIDLDPIGNLLAGPNGAGKTALLESVFLLSTGRSFRSGRPGSLIRHGAESLLVRGTRLDDVSLAIERSRDGQQRLRLRGEPCERLADLARSLPSLALLPDIAELVFGAPDLRRRALDWGLFHVERSFNDDAGRYARCLRQRNAVLRRLAQGEADTGLGVWTERLAGLGEALSVAREHYLARIRPRFAAELARLDADLDVRLEYTPGFNAEVGLIDELSQHWDHEIRRATTLYGPHRADLRIRSDNHAAGSVLSRGQGKMVALALRLAQVSDLVQQRDIVPILLVDDIGAELDRDRGERLLEALTSARSQIIATTADDVWARDAGARGPLAALSERWPVFHVEQGSVNPVTAGAR
ncbi:MAG: DNA replication and repair protein RecF [Pseudomonadota bacterium]